MGIGGVAKAIDIQSTCTCPFHKGDFSVWQGEAGNTNSKLIMQRQMVFVAHFAVKEGVFCSENAGKNDNGIIAGAVSVGLG